jgi:SAM-dependent methyltransferase
MLRTPADRGPEGHRPRPLAVGDGLGDVASIARHCGASERGTRILCDFLVINGVLVKDEGRYHHSATSAAFLDPRSPACLASIAQFLGNQAMREPYDRLAEVVRSGRTVLPGDGSVEPENPIWVQFAETMAPMMAPMAGPLGAVVLQGHAGPMRVLDIAAGHGLFGIEIAKQNPEARVTGLDWAPVLRVALDNARKAGVHERYDMLPGSAFEVEFGGPYDVVLLTNFLHHFDQPACVGLLQKVHRALRSGGRVATLEFVPNEDCVAAGSGGVRPDHADVDGRRRRVHPERVDVDVRPGGIRQRDRAPDPDEPAHHRDGTRLTRATTPRTIDLARLADSELRLRPISRFWAGP